MVTEKINWVSAHELKKIIPNCNLEYNTSDINLWYQAIKEDLLEQGFVFLDEKVEFINEYKADGYYYYRYNVVTVRTIKRNNKNVIHEIGVVYLGIKNTHKTDLDKLVMALNNLRIPAIHGVPEEDGVQAYEYLKRYVEKMRSIGVENLKQLLK